LELLLVYWFTFLWDSFCMVEFGGASEFVFFSVAALNGFIQMERHFKSVKQLMPYYFALAVFGISALGMFYLCR